MSSLTARLGLYLPADDGSEDVDVSTDLNDNLERLDVAVGFLNVTSSTRPAAPFNGQAIRETNTLKHYVHDGTVPASAGWVQALVGSAGFDPAANFNSSVTASGVLNVYRPLNSDPLFSGYVAGDTQPRVRIDGDGSYNWGPGGSAAPDTDLYRTGVAQLTTGGSLILGGALTVGGSASFSGNLTVGGVGQIVTGRRLANSTARTNNTLTADTDIVIPVAADAVYLMDGFLTWSCASSTPGFKIDFTGPTGATMPMRNFQAQPIGNTGTTGTVDTGCTTSISGVDARHSINGTTSGVLHGKLVTSSTAGNLTLRWAQNTTNASGVTLLDGSWIRLIRVS